MFLYFTTFLGAIALSLSLTWHVRNIALARGWVCSPPSPRHVHTAPIPRFGGVSIYLSFAIMIGIVVASFRYFGSGPQFPASNGWRILLPATLIFLAGLYDDIYSARPYAKIVVQVAAGVLLFLGGLRVLQIPILFGDRALGSALSLLLTVLWVLLITNAFNLIDGLDGLAAGSALLSTFTVFVVSLIHGNREVSMASLVLAGAIIGFLRFNFNPATIFLGDCGSLFIGFMLSALSLEGIQQKSSTIIAVSIPIVSFGLPILDTTISIVRRLISGRPLFTADREHIHHKLLEMGFSHRGAVAFLYGVSAICGLLSLFLLHGGESLGIVLVVLGTGIWFGVQHLRYHEFFELKRVAQRTFKQRQIIVNDLRIRRSAEQLWKAEEYSEICRILEDTFVHTDFDGFELYISRQNPRFGEALGGKTCLHYVWQRYGGQTAAAAATDCGLTLTLNLMGAVNQQTGSFSLHKAAASSSLLVDVSLLASEFASALADASNRYLIQSEYQQPVESKANAAVAGIIN